MSEEQLDPLIVATFGVHPNSWKHYSAPVARRLLDFARFAYVEAPLPSLFKQKLFAYLSRYSTSQYCVARHVGFLLGYGFVAGDSGCEPLAVDAALDLLRKPTPSATDLIRKFSALRDVNPLETTTWPEDIQEELVVISTGLFLNIGDSTTTILELSRFLGSNVVERLLLLLQFIRNSHANAEARFDLRHDNDVVHMFAVHPRLSHWVQTYRATVAAELENQLSAERMRLEHLRDQLASQIRSPDTAINELDPRQVLSERELSTFECIGRGLSTKEIADQLSVSSKTIETYRARLKRKLGIKTMSELSTRATIWVLKN